MKRLIVLGTIMLLGGLSMAASALQAPPTPAAPTPTPSAAPAPAAKVAEIEKVKDNLFLLKGGGGNTAAFITEKGVVVVDTKTPAGARPSSTRSRRSPTSR